MSISSSAVGGRTKYKIIFLGDQSVGKSSIIEKFVKNKFEDGLTVYIIIIRQPSVSIFISKTSVETVNSIECSYGILQDKNVFEV